MEQNLQLFRPLQSLKPQNTFFMEGINDYMPIVDLSPRQMGILFALQPNARKLLGVEKYFGQRRLNKENIKSNELLSPYLLQAIL